MLAENTQSPNTTLSKKIWHKPAILFNNADKLFHYNIHERTSINKYKLMNLYYEKSSKGINILIEKRLRWNICGENFERQLCWPAYTMLSYYFPNSKQILLICSIIKNIGNIWGSLPKGVIKIFHRFSGIGFTTEQFQPTFGWKALQIKNNIHFLLITLYISFVIVQ